MGVQPNYATVRYIPMAQGRFLDDADLSERRRVAVLGSKTAILLYSGRPMLGETITINGIAFTIVGQVGKISRGTNDGHDQRVYIPVTTMQELFALQGRQRSPGRAHLHSIPARTSAAMRWPRWPPCDRVIAQRHGFDPSLTDAFDEFDSIEEERMVGAIFNAMDVFLGGVGIVTLGLGAVGIINIMLVSVTERTREIGLLKAIGATKRSIVAQFFWEGLLLTGISGLIGIAASAVFMWVLQYCLTDKMPGWDPPRLVPWSAALALGSLVLCGVAAGLYPASKAAQWTPSRPCGGSEVMIGYALRVRVMFLIGTGFSPSGNAAGRIGALEPW